MKLTQKVLPAISNHKSLQDFINSNLEYGLLMNFELAQLPSLVSNLKAHNKKVIVHQELIKGLARDEHGALYLIQELKVDGIVTSKAKVITLCNKRGVISILRIFLKDLLSLEQGIVVALKTLPNYVEILPSSAIMIVEDIKLRLNIDLIFSGLIHTREHAINCLKNGAIAISTSNPKFWDI